ALLEPSTALPRRRGRRSPALPATNAALLAGRELASLDRSFAQIIAQAATAVQSPGCGRTRRILRPYAEFMVRARRRTPDRRGPGLRGRAGPPRTPRGGPAPGRAA